MSDVKNQDFISAYPVSNSEDPSKTARPEGYEQETASATVTHQRASEKEESRIGIKQCQDPYPSESRNQSAEIGSIQVAYSDYNLEVPRGDTDKRFRLMWTKRFEKPCFRLCMVEGSGAVSSVSKLFVVRT